MSDTVPTGLVRAGVPAPRRPQPRSRHHAPALPTGGATLTRWPASPRLRWLSRLALAFPFLVVTVHLHATGQVSAATSALVEVARVAFAASGPFGGAQHGYPPLAVAVAALPAGALAVDMAAAAAAGLAAHAVTERLVRRAVPVWLVVTVVTVVIGLIGLGLRFTHNPSGFVALCLLVVALDGVTRFATVGDTHGGFVAGLLVAAAFLTDPRVLPFALALGLVSPLVARQRHLDQPGSSAATAAVLLFPTAASVAAWTFLEWRFTGGVAMVTDLLVVPGPGAAGSALALVVAVLALSPLFLAVGVMLAARRPLALVAYAFAPLGIGLTVLLEQPWSVERGVALLALLAAMTLPARPLRHQQLLLGAACAVQALVVVLVLL
jgi:hypothetical protein